MHIHVIYSERDLNPGVQHGMYYKFVFKTLTLACRTGIIFFCVFQSSRGKREASAKCESRARGEERKKINVYIPSRLICALCLRSTCRWSPVKRNKLHRFCTSPKVKPTLKTITNHKEPWYRLDFRRFFVLGLRSSLRRDSIGKERGLIFPNSGW